MENTQLKLGNQVCFPIYSVSRLLTKAYRPHLEQLGLTYPQYLVLLVLWEKDKCTVNHITEKLFLNTNTLSPLLKRMEKMNLLERIRSNADERNVIIQLTDTGSQLKTLALSIPENLLKTLLTENITMNDITQLRDTLNEWITILKSDTKNLE
ncbi:MULTISPECIES: MarR family winged helix-turn-helix transcriptional regulator [unclassified Flavobacterium]|jgi:DNA-binding MarR family transcriptional regulator|uniref:MarR family winged helix-turn-helix transcriptional regulator n=1 Tax=unclassified Flavobacterium TaxID=196869 RepID=UPI00131C1161|nr:MULTISPECIES: MarR family transcriptional regulator [unclassified Flavobacterium]